MYYYNNVILSVFELFAIFDNLDELGRFDFTWPQRSLNVQASFGPKM